MSQLTWELRTVVNCLHFRYVIARMQITHRILSFCLKLSDRAFFHNRKLKIVESESLFRKNILFRYCMTGISFFTCYFQLADMVTIHFSLILIDCSFKQWNCKQLWLIILIVYSSKYSIISFHYTLQKRACV